ncbi:MAG: hypothetical protein WCF81_15290 [Roseiarcus sp.]
MTIKFNGALGRCLGDSAVCAFIAVALVPPAAAQWTPRWGVAFPGEIERNLEAQGYVLTAPLIRRPGVYLADVSAGPAGRQRLIIDARSGQVLERFPAPGRTWGPALATRDEAFGEPQDDVGPALGPGFSGASTPAAPASNVHIPAAVSSYGVGETRAGTKAKPKPASTEHRATINPPLPPPAPRETARLDRSGITTPQPTQTHDSQQPRTDSHSTEAGKERSASAPSAQGPSTEASDKPKVSIIPPGLYQ